MSRKLLGLPLAFFPLLLISTSAIAYGAITIVSNVQTVTISYLLTLSEPSLSGSTVTMVATLTNGVTPVSNAQVAFFHCDASGARAGENTTALNTIVTNGLGEASLTYMESSNAVYHYVAVYVAP